MVPVALVRKKSSELTRAEGGLKPSFLEFSIPFKKYKIFTTLPPTLRGNQDVHIGGIGLEGEENFQKRGWPMFPLSN